MYAVEFETDAKEGIIKIPEEYKSISNAHLKIVALKVEKSDQEFSEEELLQNLQEQSLANTWNNQEDEAWNEL